jgi:hypothetical protein
MIKKPFSMKRKKNPFFLFSEKRIYFSLPRDTFKTSFLLNLASSVNGFFFHDVFSLEELLPRQERYLSPFLKDGEKKWERKQIPWYYQGFSEVQQSSLASCSVRRLRIRIVSQGVACVRSYHLGSCLLFWVCFFTHPHGSVCSYVSFA